MRVRKHSITYTCKSLCTRTSANRCCMQVRQRRLGRSRRAFARAHPQLYYFHTRTHIPRFPFLSSCIRGILARNETFETGFMSATMIFDAMVSPYPRPRVGPRPCPYPRLRPCPHPRPRLTAPTLEPAPTLAQVCAHAHARTYTHTQSHVRVRYDLPVSCIGVLVRLWPPFTPTAVPGTSGDGVSANLQTPRRGSERRRRVGADRTPLLRVQRPSAVDRESSRAGRRS